METLLIKYVISQTKAMRKKYFRNAIRVGLCLTIFLLIMCCIFVFDIRKVAAWMKRLVIIKLMSVWKLQNVRDSRCLVANSYMQTQQHVTSICGICEAIREVTILPSTYQTSTDVAEIGRRFLQSDIPFMYKHNSGSEAGVSRLEDFLDAFLNNHELSLYEPCQYDSNRKARNSLHDVLHLIGSGYQQSAYAIWENCVSISVKAFRSFYGRPEILGPNIQITGTNWAMVCKNYAGNGFKLVEIYSPLTIVMVYHGYVELSLKPEDECAEQCSQLPFTLQKGEMLVFASDVYKLYLKASCPTDESIIIGAGATMDL